MLTDMGCVEAATALAPLAPAPAGPGGTGAPEAAGAVPFASSAGGTGGPMNAGFAALIAAGLVDVGAAVVGWPGLVPVVAKPCAGAFTGVTGAGMRDGGAGSEFAGTGAPGFGGIAAGFMDPAAGAEAPGGRDAVAVGAGAVPGVFIIVPADGLAPGARATMTGDAAGTAGPGAGFAFGTAACDATGGAAGFAPGSWAEAGGASGGCQLGTPRDTEVETLPGAGLDGFELVLAVVAVAAGFAVGLAETVAGAFATAGFATGVVLARVTGTCTGVGGSSGLVAGADSRFALVARTES